MYRCKECGTEYEVKPDYCDCGNDEFEQLQPELDIKPAEEKPEIKRVKPAEARSNKTFTPPPVRTEYNEQYSFMKRLFSAVDPLSLAFFCVCIVVSFYIVFCAWNPKELETPAEQTNELSIPKNIPSIDKIWNNALPVQVSADKKAEQKEEVISKIIPVILPQQTAETKKIIQQVSQPKVTRVPLKKVETTPKKVQKNTATVKTNTSVQEKAKKEAEEKARQEALIKQKAEQERKAAEAEHLKILRAEQAKKAEAEKVKQEAAARQDYINYKAQLRNTLGRKIDFTRVIGDGSCTVAFKIDPYGNLINRSFAKQSTNNTLNDAVYNAVMSTPTFNPPPRAYKNETLNLSIRFYNGNFEISLP